ncbi:MAG: hypothetical protein KF851_08030 [Pirellulaceae bacterium]|nr:hypothetical protein [Pirellulaceae bacterium]
MTDRHDKKVSTESLKDTIRRWETVTSQINADRPIQTLEQDLLERGTFCFSLANAIREWRGEESLVIGLYGPWGSGKSSVKNMVVSLLEKSEPKIPVVEFNPWSWSGEDRLASAFFDELGAALPALGHGADSEALAKKWKAYATRMTLGGTALGHLKTASEVAGIPWVPMILGTLSATADSASKLAAQASKAHEATDDTPAQKLKE